jgi:hypothetical protein
MHILEIKNILNHSVIKEEDLLNDLRDLPLSPHKIFTKLYQNQGLLQCSCN